VTFRSNFGRATIGRNFDDIIGRVGCEACTAISNLCISSAFDPGPREKHGETAV
jgi:hypothetical protein